MLYACACAGSKFQSQDGGKALRFYCEICGKDYQFSSRYNRYLTTGSHHRLEAILKVQQEKSSDGEACLDSGFEVRTH